MTTFVLLPVKEPARSKRRLAQVLDSGERARLRLAMFRHVFATASEAVDPAKVVVVCRDPRVLALAAGDGALSLMERGEGLNPALEQAARHAARCGATRVLSLGCDLPLLRCADIAAMIAAGERARMVLGPDRSSRGTNAMLMPLAGRLPYAYGQGSALRHRRAAEAAGASFTTVVRRGLAEDLDLPGHLAHLARAPDLPAPLAPLLAELADRAANRPAEVAAASSPA